MEDWILQNLLAGRPSAAGVILFLVGVSVVLLKRIVVGERDKIRTGAESNAAVSEQLAKRLEALEEMNVTNMQRISLLAERDEARAAEYVSLKTRIDTLDNRLEALSRDLHTGISEIKTLIIHQRHL